VVKATREAITVEARPVADAPTARPMTAQEKADLGIE
jgi:hypothetical protein